MTPTVLEVVHLQWNLYTRYATAQIITANIYDLIYNTVFTTAKSCTWRDNCTAVWAAGLSNGSCPASANDNTYRQLQYIIVCDSVLINHLITRDEDSLIHIELQRPLNRLDSLHCHLKQWLHLK